MFYASRSTRTSSLYSRFAVLSSLAGLRSILLLFLLAALGMAGNLPLAAQMKAVPVITTVVGNVSNIEAGEGKSGYGGDGGAATSASTLLNLPAGIAFDAAGNLYIADMLNNRIRKVAAATGIITTVVGDGAANYDGDNQIATSAELNSPSGIAFDAAGNLYIADSGSNRIRMVAATTSSAFVSGTLTPGYIYTVAGDGTAASSATAANGDGAAATSAQLNSPLRVAFDAAGNLYIADSKDNRIRMVAATSSALVSGALTPRYIYTVAGTGTAPSSGTDANGDTAAAISALLNSPSGVAFDAAGNLYIADSGDYRIRMVAATTSSALVSGTLTPRYIYTVAGTGTAGLSGDLGAATSAELNKPLSVAIDAAGNLYIADSEEKGGDNRIRMVVAATGNGYTADYIYTVAGTIAGTEYYGYTGDGGAATSAKLYLPFCVALDAFGNVYIADSLNNVIREVSAIVPPLNETIITFPTAAVGTSAAVQNVLLETTAAETITSISAAVSMGGKQEFTVGTITGCTVDGSTSNASGTTCIVPITFKPGYPGLRQVALTVVTSSGKINFSLTGTGTGPMAALTPGIITTVAGTGSYGYSGDGGAATSAKLSTLKGVAVDSAGNLYIAEINNQRIRKVDTSGNISTVAGNGTQGYSGDGGAATSAEFNGPIGVAVDGAGNLYIADISNNRIRKVDASTGIISTVAGNGTGIGSYSGDGAAATSAGLGQPSSVAVDSARNLYITNRTQGRIRKVDASTGIISTVAGNGTAGYSGDGGAAISAELNYPGGLAVDSAGNLYIAEYKNERIRKVDTSGIISTVAGNGTQGNSGDGGAATSAEFNNPEGMAVDSAGNIYIGDYEAYSVRKVNVSASSLSFTAATSIGSTDTTDGPQTVTISNIGNATLTFAVPASGSNPTAPDSNFLFNSGSTCPVLQSASPAFSLASGADCTYEVDFQPTAVSNSSSLQLTDDSLNVTGASQTIALSGTGVTPTSDATTTTVSLSAASVTVGLPVNITVTVADTSHTGTTPTGSVTLSWTCSTCTTTSGTLGSESLNSGSYIFSSGALAAGTYTFTASYAGVSGSFVSSDNSSQSSGNTLTVNGGVTATQSVATKGITVNHAVTSFTPVTGTGGTAPLSYSVAPALPGGLSISATTGAISGTPTAASSATTYTVTVTDANSATATATFSLTVNATVTATQSVATTGMTVNRSATTFTPVTGTGGTAPLSYSVAPALPGGLSISATTGAISGTPTAASSATTYTVTVTDANGATATVTFSLTVNATVTATQSVATTTLILNQLATAFTPVTGASGTAPLSYSVAPTLPSGLSISATTGAISGTPTAASSATTYTVTVIDANGATATATFSLTVNSTVTPSTPTVTWPTASAIIYGQTLASSTLSGGSASVAGSFAFTAPGTAPSAGTAQQSVTFTPTDATNYLSVTSTVSLTVMDFSVAPTTGSTGSGDSDIPTQTVVSGGTATYTVAILPTNGTVFPLPITLTVSGMPNGATVVITPATWAQTSSTSWSFPANTPLTNIVMSIQLPSTTASLHQEDLPFRKLPSALWGLLLMPFVGRLRRTGKRLGRSVSLLLLLAVGIATMAGMSGCGAKSGFFVQSQKTYTVLMTATSGTLSHSTTVTLTVK